MNTPSIPFEQLPAEVAYLRQEIREMKELLKIKVAPPNEREYITTKEAAKFLSTSPVGLRQRMKTEEIPHIKKGRFLYFKKSDLIDYLEADRVATDAEIEAELMDVFKTKK